MTRRLPALVAWFVVVASCDRAPGGTAPPRQDDGAAPAVAVAAGKDAGVIVDATPAPDGPSATLEVGKWWLGHGKLCVEVFDKQWIEIAVDGQTRHKARVFGQYQAEQIGEHKLRVRIDKVRILSKQLTSCRKSWEDRPLKHVNVLGQTVLNGGALTFTLELLDGGAKAELCVLSCATLSRTERSGRPSPKVSSKADEW